MSLSVKTFPAFNNQPFLQRTQILQNLQLKYLETNMASHISAHNKKVLNSKIEAEVKTCKHFAYPCPLQNRCNDGPLVYQADVSTNPTT